MGNTLWLSTAILFTCAWEASAAAPVMDFDEHLFGVRQAEDAAHFRNGRPVEGKALLEALTYKLADLPEAARHALGESLSAELARLDDGRWADRAHQLATANRLELTDLRQEL